MAESNTNPTEPTTPADPSTNPTEPTDPKPPESSAELETLKTTNTAYENALKSIFGISDGEELGDVAQQLADYTNMLETKAAAVDDRIITAELKAIQGYDNKLLAKVIDRTNIKVADDGTVTGLTEAIAAAEKEYPAVVVKTATKPYAPLNPAPTTGSGTNMNDLIRKGR